MAGLGAVSDAIMLFDLSVRVTTFINDLRHAQDDFIGLRSEADCLRICLGSLTSESCQNALYHYMDVKQGEDLKQIIENTKFNMMDLNTFIASCAKLDNKNSPGVNKNVFKKIGKAIGKLCTSWKFVMTDKQPFRDKLVLPTASINVFLTSMTHVGLVNMGRIMIMTGHSVPISSGTGTRHGIGGGGGKATADILHGWQAVGKRVAFRNTIVKASDITPSFEHELLEYALHLIRGGQPFYVKPSSAGTKHKVTKTTRTKTRSRSQSRGPLGIGKGGSGQKYVMRKKSFSRPSTEKVEIVEREWHTGSDSDAPGRRLLALPAPDSPSSSRQYPEIKPDSASDSDQGYHRRRDSGREKNNHYEERSPRREERRGFSGRERSHSAPRRGPTLSREEIRSRRRDIRSDIRAEQEEAYRELEQEQQIYRTQRAQNRMSRPASYSRAEEIRFEQEEEEDDVIAFLAEKYGVMVEELEIPREPIDSGIVKDIPPPVESEGIEIFDSDSEDDDSPPTPPAPGSRSRAGRGRSSNDGLRAQTYRSAFSGSGHMRYGARYEPYPDPSRFRSGARPRPFPGYYDEAFGPSHERPHFRPGHSGPVPEVHIAGDSSYPSGRHSRYPHERPPYRRNSDDSDPGMYGMRRPPGPPGPGSGPGDAPYYGGGERIIINTEDAMRELDKGRTRRKDKKSSLKPETGLERRRSYQDRDRSEFLDERHIERRIIPPQFDLRSTEAGSRYGGDDIYMRGARSQADSDGSHDGIEIVTK